MNDTTPHRAYVKPESYFDAARACRVDPVRQAPHPRQSESPSAGGIGPLDTRFGRPPENSAIHNSEIRRASEAEAEPSGKREPDRVIHSPIHRAIGLPLRSARSSLDPDRTVEKHEAPTPPKNGQPKPAFSISLYAPQESISAATRSYMRRASRIRRDASQESISTPRTERDPEHDSGDDHPEQARPQLIQHHVIHRSALRPDPR